MKNYITKNTFFLLALLSFLEVNIAFSQTKQAKNNEQQQVESFVETIGNVKFKMIKIPNKPYYMAETELTQALWEEIMGEKTNQSFHQNCPQCPVEMVTWKSVTGDFIKNIMKKTGKAYRLPTIEEWEYAARGGETYKYAGSNNLDEVAWYFRNSDDKTHPVKQKKPNGYQLYDMLGNVEEWCQDPYETKAGKRCQKGGSFLYMLKGAYRIEKKKCYMQESLDLPAQMDGIRLALTAK